MNHIKSTVRSVPIIRSDIIWEIFLDPDGIHIFYKSGVYPSKTL